MIPNFISKIELRVKNIDNEIANNNLTKKEIDFLLACKQIYLRDIKILKEIKKQHEQDNSN